MKEEYFHLNEIVEDFDQKALTIKAWSVTLSMAGIGVAFTQKAASLASGRRGFDYVLAY